MLMMRDKGREDDVRKLLKPWTRPELVRLEPDSPKVQQALRKLGRSD